MTIMAAAPGEIITISARFVNPNGSPVSITGNPSWQLRDDAGRLVSSGVGTVDGTDSSRYVDTVTIPISAPLSVNNNGWSVQWNAKTTGNDGVSIKEVFRIARTGDEDTLHATSDVITCVGAGLSDMVVLPASSTAVNYKIISPDGSSLLEQPSISASMTYNGISQFKVSLPQHNLPVNTSDIGHYMGYWAWIDSNGIYCSEGHPIYVISQAGMSLLVDLRRRIDRIRLKNVHEYLSITDGDLIHFLIRGISWCNGYKGAYITQWNLVTLPHGLTTHIVAAAAMLFCQSQSLGEGQSAFDYQGLGVQLSVDRTQYWDNQYNNFLQQLQDFDLVKKNWINSGGPVMTATGVVNSVKRPVAYRSFSMDGYSNVTANVGLSGIGPGWAMRPRFRSVWDNILPQYFG